MARGSFAKIPSSLPISTSSAKITVTDVFSDMLSRIDTLTPEIRDVIDDILQERSRFEGLDLNNFDLELSTLPLAIMNPILPHGIDLELLKVSVDKIISDIDLRDDWPTQSPSKPILKEYGDTEPKTAVPSAPDLRDYTGFDLNYIKPELGKLKPYSGLINVRDQPDPPRLDDYDGIDTEYTPPDGEIPIDIIGGELVWYASLYTSELLEQLYILGKEYASESFQPGITESAHTAMVERHRRARNRDEEIEYRQLIGAVSGSSRLNGGVVLAAQAEFQRQRAERSKDDENKILEMDFDYSYKFREFRNNLAVDIEKIRIDVWDRSEARGLDYAKSKSAQIVSQWETIIRAHLGRLDISTKKLDAAKIQAEVITEKNKGKIEIFLALQNSVKIDLEQLAQQVQIINIQNQEEVNVFREKWAGVRASIDAARAHIDAITSENTGKVSVFTGQLDALRTEVDKIGKEIDLVSAYNKGLTDSYTAEWDGQRTQVEAIARENEVKASIAGIAIGAKNLLLQISQEQFGRWSGQWDVIDRIKRLELARQTSQADMNLKVEGINQDGYANEVNLRIGALQSVAGILAQMTASFVSTINASAGMSFSGSESRSHSLNDSASFSESIDTTP